MTGFCRLREERERARALLGIFYHTGSRFQGVEEFRDMWERQVKVKETYQRDLLIVKETY